MKLKIVGKINKICILYYSMKGICPLKQFNDIFGLPGQGVHQYKLLNVIIIDNLMTIAAAIFITYYFDIPAPLSIIGVYIASIVIHMLFGVQTKTLTYLGIQC